MSRLHSAGNIASPSVAEFIGSVSKRRLARNCRSSPRSRSRVASIRPFAEVRDDVAEVDQVRSPTGREVFADRPAKDSDTTKALGE